MKIKAGSTGVSVYYYIVQDASGTSPGEPVTGLLFSDIETGGSASYARQGADRVDLTLITLASASATHADGGFILVDDNNMPGLYRCDYPDAAFLTGVDQTFCQIVVASANNAVAAPILIDIDDNVDQTADHTAGIAAIKVTTDKFAFTVANQVDSNMLTHTATIPSNYITAAGIAVSALDSKGDWNIDKTGYSLTVQDWNTTTPPTTAQIWAETTRVLTSGLNIVLAKGIGVINFNDITAASVLAAGDIDGFSLEEAQKLILASAAGILAGAATTSITIEAADGSKTRLTATVDADGNRSAVIKDVTG